ncbi:MAG: L-2-amino-thiazoline-4-carboxylic acid hydrolase [Promethearchaeota archaeon]
MNHQIMDNEENKDYYIKNKKKILKQFNSLVKVAKKIALPNYDIEIVEKIIENTYKELENLLVKIPYVGGDKSPFTPLMIQSAETIALYKACKSLNLTKREIGKIIYDIAENSAQSISFFKKFLYRRAIFSKKLKNYWEYWLNESQKRLYPENWLGVFVESDEKSFDYGFNFTECGCLKLLDKENAKEIAPYICLCDYARMRAFGIGFKRNKTIAAGSDICDFRFIRDYQTPRGWPPESLEENKTFKM